MAQPGQHFVPVAAIHGFTFLFLLYFQHSAKTDSVKVSSPPAELRGEREPGGRGAEQAVAAGEDPVPALRPSGLEPQRVDGPEGGGVRLPLQ